jgi:hypothetical protein
MREDVDWLEDILAAVVTEVVNTQPAVFSHRRQDCRACLSLSECDHY